MTPQPAAFRTATPMPTTITNHAGSLDISKVYEFWLRAENYEDVPIPIAFEMYKLGIIDVTRFAYHTKQHPEIPKNLEEMCEFAVMKEFSKMLYEKCEQYNWYYFLEYCVVSQTSEKFVKQEQKHMDSLKQYKDLLEQMDMLSGSTQSIMKFFDEKQKLMEIDPVAALSMIPPSIWIDYLQCSSELKQKHRNAFVCELTRLQYLDDWSEDSAREAASKKANAKVRRSVAAKKTKYTPYKGKPKAVVVKQEIKEEDTKSIARVEVKKEFGQDHLMELLNSFTASNE